jgi:hypothetical protein
MERIELGFARTVCDCPACTKHCRDKPGFLIPSDLSNLLNHHCPPERFTGMIEAVNAALQGDMSKRHIVREAMIAFAEQHLLASLTPSGIKKIPTLVPRTKPGTSECHWLTQEGHCQTHDASPYGCAFFDEHQSREEGDRRAEAGIMEVIRDIQRRGPYAVVWVNLVMARKVKEPFDWDFAQREFRVDG